MKFNKRILSFVFIAVFAIVLVACGGNTTAAPTTATPTTEAPTTVAPTTQAPTTAFSMDAAVTALETYYADTLMDDNYKVEDDLTLLSEILGATVTWESSKPEYVTNAGIVTQPLKTVGDQTSILTATIAYGDETEEVVFFATVKALAEKTGQEIATEVFLIAMAFPEKDAWNSADSLTLLTTVADKDGTEHTVTWSSSHPEVISLGGEIIQQESGDVEVTLTASITINSETFTATYVFNVAVLPTLDGTVTTIAEALALGVDSYVKLEDMTIVAIHDGGSVFFTDGTDILFVYSPSYSVTVGEVYDMYGLIDEHYFAPQLGGSSTHPLLAIPSDGTAKEVPYTVAAGIEDIISASSLPSAENPHEYKSYTVTASVYYKESWGNYSLFLVPTDYDFDAPLASGATQPNGNAIMIYYPSNDEALRSFHGLQVTLDITMQGYRTDKLVYYANYFGTTEDVDFYFETNQDGLNAAFNSLTLPKYALENDTIELPTVLFKDITMAYSSSDETAINSTTGAITVADVNTYKEVTLSVTATYNEVSETRDYVIPLGIPAKTDIATALASENGYLFNVDGTVVAGGYYNTFFIQDATGNIALYAKGDDAALLEANVGNVVNVIGSRGAYAGLNQLSVEQVTALTDTPLTITETNVDAMALDSTGLADYQGMLVELTGMVIVDVYVDTYDNIQFTLERLSDGDTIKLRWDARYDLPTDVNTLIQGLEVGDKVDVTTVLSWYNGPQLLVTTTIDVVVSALSDQEKVDLDVRYLDDELVLNDDLLLVGDFGSTVTVESIFGNAVNYLDYTTTAGTLLVSQPQGKYVTGTITLTFTSGTASESVTVDVVIPGTELDIITDLFISEYGEGSSNNKWLEIYNGTGSDVDLSEYMLKYYSGGATDASPTYSLTGILANGDVYVLTTDQAMSDIKDLADQIFPYPSVVHFNGDDAIELVKGETVIDVIGEVGEDPGTAWTVGTGATAEFTLVRNSAVKSGNTVFTETEWDVHPQNTITNIGVHTVDALDLEDAEIVGLDRASLNLDQYVYAAKEMTLPTTGAYGSTITWAEAEDAGDNATLAANVLSLNAVETDAVVVMEATFTSNAVTETSIYRFYLVGATEAERVADDKAELTALALDEEIYITADRDLPLMGSMGSDITWAITTDLDSMATLNTAGDVVSFLNAMTTESTVVLTATITYGTTSDTVTVTYTLKAYAITDLGDIATTDLGTTVAVQGNVFAILKDGFFIEDTTGKLFIYNSNHSYVLGDEVHLTGLVGEYKEARQLTNLLDMSAPLTTGNDVTQTALDYTHGVTTLVPGETYSILGTVAIEGTYNNAYIYLNATDKIEIYYNSPDASVDAIKAMVGKMVKVELIYYNNNTVFAFVGTALDIEEVTDAEAIATDASNLPANLTLGDDYVLPTALFGSTYTVTAVSSELTGYLDHTTTAGTFLITRPASGSPDAVGTVTISVSKGTETPQTVVINVTVKALVVASDLFISEYAEGSSNNKWIEIYNGTGVDVDLTAYKVALYSNGSATYGNNLDLTGTLAAGDVLVIYNSSVALANVIAEGDISSTITYFNGDDAVALLKDEVVIDVIGVIGSDPGSYWPVNDGTTQNYTIVRTIGTTGPNTTFTETEWEVYPVDTDAYVGFNVN